MAKIFTSIRSENKILKALICHKDQDQHEAIKNIELVVNSNISPQCFTSDFRGWLYSTITSHYFEYSAPITEDLLQEKIIRKYKRPESIADAKALLQKILIRQVESLELAPIIDELKNLYHIRKIFDTTNEVLEQLRSIKEGSADVKAGPLVRKLEKAIEEINDQSNKERIVEEDAFENIDKDIAEIKDRHDNPEKYRGVDTGIEPLTLATAGWHGGDLITVMGRTGQGKSIVLLNFGYSAWLSGYNVLYVTIEMPILQQKRRLYSRMTGINYFKLKNADLLTDEELMFISDKIKQIKSERENVFLILDAPSMCNANFIEQRVHNFEKSTGKKIDLIIVDPIYLMKPNVKAVDDDIVGAVSWDLKLMGRKLDVPVINANQINREGHKRHLQGKDMDAMDSASSDRLGQNSDIMLGIFSDEQQWLKLSIVKYRDGRGPTLFLKRRFDVMKIEYDEEYNQHEEIMAQIMGGPTPDDSSDGDDE